jgi:hypothetical protein
MPMVTALRGRRSRHAWIDDLSRRLRLDDDQWHDAQLVEFSIQMRRRGKATLGQVTLRVAVYGDFEHARNRTPLTVAFGGVREVLTTVNCQELVDMGDDHIVFARLNETSETLDLSVHLAGGHLRIVADRFAVSTRRVLPRRGAQL